MLNIGIIGAGRIGRVHCECVARHVPQAKVMALADPLADNSLRAFAANMGIPAVYEDYMRIVGDPDIGAVLICSPTDTHTRIIVEAARAGKHIFCEKPVDIDVARIERAAEAVAKAGVTFQVGFNRRFDNNFKALREAVASGRIGRPHIIRITSRDPAPPPLSYIAASGGLFMDMAIHDFDMARFICGSEPAEVYAAGAALIDPAIGAAGDVDTAVTTIKFESGAMAVIDNSRKAAYGYDQRAEAFGPEGAVSVSNNTKSTAVFSGADGVVAEKPLYFFLERYMQSYADEIRAFADAAVNGTPPAVTMGDGLAAVRMALAAARSLAQNRPVAMSEIAGGIR